jgi:hypothetical protein
MHKGKKIILLPLTPAEIVKHDKELAEISQMIMLYTHLVLYPKRLS